MLGVLNMLKEDCTVCKKDGSFKGPYQASFTATVIILTDMSADIEEGDIIIRSLPNGNDDRHYVTKVDCYTKKIGGIMPHYQVKFTKSPPKSDEKSIQNINFHGSQNVQIGDHNVQNITNIFNELIQKIEHSSAPETEKQQAKSLLKQFLEHPLTVSVLGSAVGGLLP